MPLLDDEAMTERARKHESFRLSNVSSRLTHGETERLDALAKQRGLQRGEFIRRLILDELEYADAGTSNDPVLTEIVGVQLLLMNVLKPVATGQPLTAAAFDSIVAEVHKLKRSVARKLAQEEK
ncbi:MAG: ribbon-helix-helix protein, CopG family [Silvibacterium sp.]